MSRKKKRQAGREGKPAPRPSRTPRAGLLLLAAGLAALAGWIWWGTSSAPQPPEKGPLGPASALFVAGEDAEVFGTYAGSSSCRECHTLEYASWKDSHHALAERPLEEGDRVAFEPPRTIRHGRQVSTARLDDDRFVLETPGFEDRREAYPTERVIGVKPLRQFLVAAPGGRYQVTELAFDPDQGDWFNVFGDEDRRPGEWGHWTGRGMNWNSMCASCHNTRLRKNYEEETDTYATSMAEMGVGCESCHGPARGHVEWQRENAAGGERDPTLPRLSRERHFQTCGTCHTRRIELTGDFRPGDSFFDHYSAVIPDESDVYYPDGQVLEENFEFVSFLASRLHEGGVRCTDCHDPHSGRTRLEGNALCMSCHAGQQAEIPPIEPASHMHHRPDEPGGHCVDCHMPVTTYMQRHPRRDHAFTIPDPWLTVRHGIPNACNRCHTDMSPEWALEWVEEWYGDRMERPYRRRADLVARARAGETEIVRPLIEWISQESSPLWRAVGVTMLRPWSLDPEATRALIARVGDSSPKVRGAAARSLEPAVRQGVTGASRAVRSLLEDPIRKVRVDAAWALRSSLDPSSPAWHDLQLHFAQVTDQPGGRAMRGVFYLDRSRPAEAVQDVSRSVEWDPNSPPLRHDLALALHAAGRVEEAVRELEEAVRLDPEEAEFPFKLALALGEKGDLDGTLEWLEKAVALDPDHGQAWYNLGLTYSATERPEEALRALARAEEVHPDSARIPYARATILARLERTEEARQAARRALSLDPNHQDAAHLLRLLSGR